MYHAEATRTVFGNNFSTRGIFFLFTKTISTLVEHDGTNLNDLKKKKALKLRGTLK